VTDRELPLGEGSVPDKALEELYAAFGGDAASASAVDFDDPSIDALLGLEPSATPPSAPRVEPVPAVEPASPGDPAPAAEPEPERVAETAPEPEPATPTRAPIKIGGGDEDELPDALYLDEEAGDRLRGTSSRSTEASIRGERTTILIGDDEMEGASGGIPVATGPSSMDPRLRARRIAVKRAVGRRRLKWFVLAAVIVILLTGGFAVLGSSLFEVTNLQISGAQRISQADLDAAVQRVEHRPVLLVDTHSVEAQLERSPWVREARVTTDFPHTASIEIRERVPLATYQGPDGRFRIIDVEGRVVDLIQNQPVEFMLVIGPGLNASPGTSAGAAFGHAAELVEALSPAVRSRTKSITVSDTGELSLNFDSGATVVLGAPTELLDKLTRLEAYLKLDEAQQCTTSINVATAEIGCSQQ
jgi:cell division protein FtsQ